MFTHASHKHWLSASFLWELCTKFHSTDQGQHHALGNRVSEALTLVFYPSAFRKHWRGPSTQVSSTIPFPHAPERESDYRNEFKFYCYAYKHDFIWRAQGPNTRFSLPDQKTMTQIITRKGHSRSQNPRSLWIGDNPLPRQGYPFSGELGFCYGLNCVSSKCTCWNPNPQYDPSLEAGSLGVNSG